VVDVQMRSGSGSQSFPVVVSNFSTLDEMVEIGFSFGKLKRRHYKAIGDLMFGDVKEITTFREKRRRRHGILHGVAVFFAWSFSGPPRAFLLLWREWQASQAARNSAQGGPGG